MKPQTMFRHVILAMLPLGFLGVMVFAPLWAMLMYDDSAWLWREVLSDPYYRWRIEWTAFQAACTVVLTTLLGVPTAWALARLDFTGRTSILRALMLPFVMPTLVAGMGVLALFGDQGILWRGWADTPYLLFYGNVFFNLPVMIRAAHHGLLAVPANRLAAAQVLGANEWQRFWQVEFWVMKNHLAGGACLVFLYCFSGFGLALLLGGQRHATVEVEIYQLIAYELDMPRAAVLVWCVLAITALVGAMYAWLSQRHHSAAIQIKQPEPPQGAQYFILWTSWAILALFCALPLLAVAFQAAQSWQAWSVWLEQETWQALFNTLKFTALSLILAMILGLNHAALAKQVAWIRGFTFLPFMVSPVCLAFGVLLLYPQWSSSLMLLIALYALLAYPFVTKDILATWDNLPTNYLNAARVLGASRFQAACFVILPLLKSALRRGLTLAAATGIGEFAATLFLSRPEWTTLTTLIYQKLGRVGMENHQQAMVLSFGLMLLASGIFLLLDSKDS
ncbi:ABC transporter permease [Alysiella filiformis]|uniref:Thiamine transport system permease protein n=1 Tax=Alysiella filiformis DSM 16848 TaxID=1120981 RepID=A0A286ECP7_9NEIS|nr:iron ABC transporter permease [Alysiella filiformis]QMT31893.1 iron ABC transporter permease [Alysiella filiformis]UBQ57200.1 iron ABC transporter permease [Alysiella filiformis DSM 16848]SOD68707.1 thiamine transport system permease protein [Alysiella filiformis DSM 16848]